MEYGFIPGIFNWDEENGFIVGEYPVRMSYRLVEMET